MSRIYQADIARHLALPQMAISRAVKALGRDREPLTDHAALLLLVAGEANRTGLAWPIANEIIRKFDGEIRFLAGDPSRRVWLVFAERGGLQFQIACVSNSHLDSVLQGRPLSMVLALHVAVGRALEQLESLLTVKEVA